MSQMPSINVHLFLHKYQKGFARKFSNLQLIQSEYGIKWKKKGNFYRNPKGVFFVVFEANKDLI